MYFFFVQIQGREYDEIGNMRNWWNNATLLQFKVRTKCIEEQYSGYHISAQNVSGSLTLGENIADNGGLQTAYDAYKAWLKKQDFDHEQPLPGLKHSHDQLFFLSFAQVKYNKGFLQKSVFFVKFGENYLGNLYAPVS